MHLVIAITGASGIKYGIKLLEYLNTRDDINVDLIISKDGMSLIEHECETCLADIAEAVDNYYDNSDFMVPISSGSKKFDAMIIVPCSMSTLSKISMGISDNLITRTASVALKEHRDLILVPRETPLSAIQLKNMTKLAKLGVCILPAMPAFYPEPKEIDDLLNFIAGKILDQLDIENDQYRRWTNE